MDRMLGVDVLAAHSPAGRNVVADCVLESLDSCSRRVMLRVKRPSMNVVRIYGRILPVQLLRHYNFFSFKEGGNRRMNPVIGGCTRTPRKMVRSRVLVQGRVHDRIVPQKKTVVKSEVFRQLHDFWQAVGPFPGFTDEFHAPEDRFGKRDGKVGNTIGLLSQSLTISLILS